LLGMENDNRLWFTLAVAFSTQNSLAWNFDSVQKFKKLQATPRNDVCIKSRTNPSTMLNFGSSSRCDADLIPKKNSDFPRSTTCSEIPSNGPGNSFYFSAR
jgi:hypothetical protein